MQGRASGLSSLGRMPADGEPPPVPPQQASDQDQKHTALQATHPHTHTYPHTPTHTNSLTNPSETVGKLLATSSVECLGKCA